MAVPDEAHGRSRRRIGRYLVTGKIGRGGMGMVYRGFDEALEREVAVKTLTAEGSFDEESRKRFHIEAKAAARLQHPNIVTVFELGEDRGVAFIAMEMLPGIDLEGLVRSGEPLLLQEKLDVVIQVCRGLAYAHEHGIIHRDIKPGNIRLLDDGTAKIMDFGIAKLGGTHLTKTGMMVGTVHYMSPEQVRGRVLDGRSDVFSVGVILYELMAGRRPFKGEGPTEVLYKIVHEEPPPLDVEGVDPRLQQIVKKALAKSPDERFASASALADDLADALEAHVRSRPGPPSPAAVTEGIVAARRALKEGRGDESLRRLRELAERHPDSLDARRALRTATREVERQRRAPEPQVDDFPELDATFQNPPTQRSPETEAQPAVALTEAVVAAEAPAGGGGRALLVAGGLLVAALTVGALAFFLSRRPEAPTGARLPVRSQPPGAIVLVDGKDTGLRTDGELVLAAPLPPQVVLTFRLAGYRDETRTVAIPPPPGEALSVTLSSGTVALPVKSDPPGAAVSLDGKRLGGATPLEVTIDPQSKHTLVLSLDGHQPREMSLEPGKLPSEVSVKLQPVGPPGALRVASVYPVDVVFRGETRAKGQVAPLVSLPAGRQTVTVVSSTYFLRTEFTVDVQGGAESTVETPGLGRINIRATPETCEVFIDGSFVDYPPIRNREVAAGTHVVSFKWPNGEKEEKTVEISRGESAFVTGGR